MVLGEFNMHRIYRGISLFAAVFSLVLASSGVASAQRVNTREVRDTLRSLNTKVDDFEYTLRFQLRGTSASRQDIEDATASTSNLKDKIAAFESNLGLRRENRNDVQEIVTAANDVKGFLRANPQSRRIESTWTDIERMIDRLAANYGVTPDWTGRISNVSGNVRDDDYDGPQPVY
jgi:hypothetical protein